MNLWLEYKIWFVYVYLSSQEAIIRRLWGHDGCFTFINIGIILLPATLKKYEFHFLLFVECPSYEDLGTE